MANGLSVLMGLAKQPGSSGNIPLAGRSDDAELDEMIPEESLYELQDEIGRRGAASGSAYAIPSRESLRSSGRAGLRQMFGGIAAKGDAAAQPSRVAGEYGLEEARIKGAADIESAREYTRSNMALRDMQHSQRMEQQDALQAALNMRQDKTIDGQNARAGARESGLAARQNITGLLRQAQEIEKQAQGSWDLFGMGSKRGLTAKAAQLRAQAAALNQSAPIPGDEDEMDVSPEEWSAFQQWRAQGAR